MGRIWRRDHPLWLAPHRPFFLLAGLAACLTPLVWLLPPGLGPEPLSWHRHEMLYGMGGAAVGGYLLTALPAWTRAGPVSPNATRLFVALWLAGRIAFAAGLPAVTAGYFLLLGAFLLRLVVRAKAWRRLVLAAAPLVLGLFDLAALPLPGLADEGAAMRLLPLVFALLIGLVGGRALTAFTLHWAEREGTGGGACAPRRTLPAAILALVAAIGSLLLDQPVAAGLLATASGVLHLACMLSWRSLTTRAYPALLLLHLAWFWLGFGLVLVGLSMLPASDMDTATAQHALTMGAMGTMMMAIMARAAMVRHGSRLLVSHELALGFALVFLSAPIRLSMPFAGEGLSSALLQIATVFWIAGWALFLLDFRRALSGPVPRPVLSAATPSILRLPLP